MADIEGFTQKEIVEKLKLSHTASKSRIQRARKMLKEEIHTWVHLNECPASGLKELKLKAN